MCLYISRLKREIPVKTYAAVAPKISFVLAVLMRLREKENTDTNAAIAPRRLGMFWMAYSTAMLAIGRRHATKVVRVLRTLSVPSSRYRIVFLRNSLFLAFSFSAF